MQISPLLELLAISYHIGSALVENPIVSSTLARRIQKLGAYFAAAQLITNALKEPTVLPLKDKISFVEVLPPERVRVTVSSNFLDISNSCASSKGEDRVQWNQLTAAFPVLKDHVEPPQGERAITTSVHCELTIAAHLFQKYKDVKARRTFDIGISKRTCWLCQRYLNFLGQSCGMRFIFSKYHGKIYPG